MGMTCCSMLGAPLLGAAGWPAVWLTSMWLLGVGALFGLILLLVIWGLVAVISPSTAASVPSVVNEGVLFPIFVVTLIGAIFSLVGLLIVRDPGDIMKSMARIPFVGTQTYDLSIAPPEESDLNYLGQTISVAFRGDELRGIEAETDQDVIFKSVPGADGESLAAWQIDAGETFRWGRSSLVPSPLAGEEITEMVVENQSNETANLTLHISTAPPHRQVRAVVITAISVVSVFLLYMLQSYWLPKISAVALAAAKSQMAQPLFPILVGLGLFKLGAFIFIPYHTFGEDIKVLKDSGLSLIMLYCIFLAVWAASTSVADEIDGKTALTMLSKPISRRQFLIGKFLGINWSVAVMFIILGSFFLLMIAYKPIYDARETGKVATEWQECHLEVIRTVPGLVLAFLETVVFVAIGVAISTRLPTLANFVICFTIYALGHLTPQIVQSGLGKIAPVQFVGSLITTVLPVLDHFNIQAAVATGADVPWSYLGMATVYCVLLSTIAMLAGTRSV